MPSPRRDDEEIPLTPVEALSHNDTESLSREDVVHGAARLAVPLRVHPGPNQLDPAADGAQRRTACGRVDILHGHIVKWASIGLGELLARRIRMFRRIVHQATKTVR